MAIGDRDIIGDVTRTVEKILTDQAPSGVLSPTLDSPADLKLAATDPGKINLYLYQVIENSFSKNQPWVTRPDGNLQYPPLSLDLFYLLTPYARDQETAHQVLSIAMELYYRNSVVEGARLVGSLGLVADQLTINLCPMKIEELTRIWNALQSPYRLSVIYQVRVALLESETIRPASRAMVVERVYSQL